MEESVSEGIYIAIFVIIFIISLSSALYLFNSISRYADIAFQFGRTLKNDSIIESSIVMEENELSGAEVYSYYLNYVDVEKKYGKSEDNKKDITRNEIDKKYRFLFKGKFQSSTEDLKLENIKLNGKYILKYNLFNDDKVEVVVTEL